MDRRNSGSSEKFKMKLPIMRVSGNVRQIKELVQKVDPNEPTTLVCGEPGVGKELVVHALYLD